jgi:hypothetical protein
MAEEPGPPSSQTPLPPPSEGSSPPPGTPERPSSTFGRRFGGFLGGCVITCGLGFVLAITLYGSTNKTLSCGFVQLAYILPAVFLLFRRGRRSVALGFLFGGAIVLMLASMCNNFNFR